MFKEPLAFKAREDSVGETEKGREVIALQGFGGRIFRPYRVSNISIPEGFRNPLQFVVQ
jgi:hypothetical protein